MLRANPRRRWVVLTYRMVPKARPLRPMIRLLRAGGPTQDFVLPGLALGAASWLGWLPADLDEIRLAAEPGFTLERVGLRGRAGVFAECALKCPSRVAPAFYTMLRGDERRFRDILRSACAVTPLAAYAAWATARLRPPEPDDPAAALSIRLVLPARRTDAARIANTIASLTAQTHPAWRLTILSAPGDEPELPTCDSRVTISAPPSGEAVEVGGSPLAATEPGGTTPTLDPSAQERGQARAIRDDSSDAASASILLGDGDALGLLDPGDILAPDALAILASGLASPDAPDLVYADEDVAGTVPSPRLKPDWSPDLALVTLYPGQPVLFSRLLLERLGQESPDRIDTLLLSAISAARTFAHVPRILCRTLPAHERSAKPRLSTPHPHPEGRGEAEPRRSPQESTEHPGDLLRSRFASPQDAHARTLTLHLRKIGSPARAEIVDGILDLHWPIPDPAPLASVVIPSRDRLDLIGRVTEDVLNRTDYPAIELVVVDNGSTDPAVLRLYERLRTDPRVRIEPFPYPFDFAAMVNAGAAAARGNVLIFLNNDIAVPQPDWLGALVAQAVRPEVGAVGAKLLYADGTLQHAGVVVGLGGRSGHILRRQPSDTPGHLGRLRVAHEVSAVTAACLAVERRKFEAVGCFDAKTFPIDFNDADLCLRLARAGWKTVWTPKATLLHLESVSRGPPSSAARARFEREADAFLERWRDVVRHDPYHHPALTLTGFSEALE